MEEQTQRKNNIFQYDFKIYQYQYPRCAVVLEQRSESQVFKFDI